MRALVSAVLVFGIAAAASAQTATPGADPAQAQSRYQIGQMERMLEGAVEHAAKNTRDRLQAVVPTSMLFSETARVRGFRLDGYGVFFDIAVPSMDVALPWSFRTLDQNDLNLENALKALRAHVDQSGDRDLQQAFQRVELQVELPSPALTQPRVTNARNAVGSAATVTAEAAKPTDSILNNPDEAYRAEVKQALMDAMLDYSGPLAIGPDEWLTFAARRNEQATQIAPQLAAPDSDAHTMVIRIKGGDLAAFRAGHLSRADALKKIDVRLF